jgi:hypothetical protein
VWNKWAEEWMAPFVMEPVNSRIVQYSSYLTGGYGPDFRYTEASGMKSLAAATAMSVGMAAVGAMFAFSFLRNLAKG